MNIHTGTLELTKELEGKNQLSNMLSVAQNTHTRAAIRYINTHIHTHATIVIHVLLACLCVCFSGNNFVKDMLWYNELTALKMCL